MSQIRVNTPDVTDRTARLLGHVTVDNLPGATRTPVTLYANALSGITTEALATLQINKGGTTSSGTSYTVTAGKTFGMGERHGDRPFRASPRSCHRHRRQAWR